MGAGDITEQDLLTAIEAFLPKPKEPGEYTANEIAEHWKSNKYRVEIALGEMIEQGLVTVREVPGPNGKAQRYYRLVQPDN